MKPKMSDVITPVTQSCVRAYLLARVYAETMTEKVTALEREILAEVPLFATLDDGARITDPKFVYLCTDEAATAEYFAECNRRTRAAGLKPATMADEFCPALVAQNLQMKAEHALVAATGAPFDVTVDKLLCSRNGLDNLRKWIDLTVKLVVSQPGFKCEMPRRAS